MIKLEMKQRIDNFVIKPVTIKPCERIREVTEISPMLCNSINLSFYFNFFNISYGEPIVHISIVGPVNFKRFKFSEVFYGNEY